MADRAIRALQRTWETICYDILQAYAGKDIDQATIPQDEVIDAVTSCGFIGGYPQDYGNDKEAVAWLEKLTQEEQDRLTKKAFPHTRYDT